MPITVAPPKFLFPSKVSVSYDTNFFEYKDNMIEWMRQYSLNNKTFERSNQGGYQSPDNFYLQESFAPYLNRITEQIQSMIDSYVSSDDCREMIGLKISNMWFNFNYKYSYNTTHVHPGCVLSGVMWVRVPENSGSLVFEADNQFGYGTVNEQCVQDFEPEEGAMVMFPAYLSHRVTQNHNDECRVSIAFNLYET
tara:strand:+ start:1571 stop:2155 length:585 start_codon:yes stop_codon:yes gene_type:complete